MVQTSEIKENKMKTKYVLKEGKMVKVNEGLDKSVKKEFNLLLLRNYQDVTPSDFVETILETIIEFSPKSKGSDGVDYTGAWSTGVISAFERLLKSKNWVVK